MRVTRWSEMTHGSGCGYNVWGNMGCFANSIVVSGFIICNILYDMVEIFSLIRGCTHFGRTILKPHIPCVQLFSLCSWTNIFTLKLSLTQQLV